MISINKKNNMQEIPSIAIIGSGISGICAFVQIQKQLGIKAQVYEMNKDIGGTWLQNTYPGCRCDVTSHMYSFSFEMNPDWSQNYSTQAEILQYLKHVAQKYGMIQQIEFETKIASAVWMNDTKQWKLEIQDLSTNETSIAYHDIIFSAVGTLRVPNIPKLYNTFSGPLMHTANWDTSINLKGKRVALIGSGASAVQVLPYLASEAGQLISFQRNSPWIMPQIISSISNSTKKLFFYFPLLMAVYRIILFFLYDLLYILLGFPKLFLVGYLEKKLVTDIKKTILELGRPDLIDMKVLPTYPIGCKRGAFSANYYQTLAQPHVIVVKEHVVDLNDKDIITDDGRSTEVDIIVLATGFKTHDGMLGDIKIFGKEGQSLTELWEDQRPQLFKSTTVHGFPNFFMLLGPYSILGHHSLIFMAETQVNYAIQCIKELDLIEPKKSAQDEYMARIISNFQGTAWLGSCTSWYKNEKGQIINLYPSSAIKFKRELYKFSRDDYMHKA